MAACGKLGLLGGSFDPVHNGHIAMALGFCKALELDRTILMPVWRPPHKNAHLLPGEHRLQMCRLACEGSPELAVSDLELRREGTSYTVDTLRELARRNPEAGFFLLMGTDMFCTVEQWREFPEIAKLAVLCGAARHKGELARLRDCAAYLSKVYGARCRTVDMPVVEVSSTEVRRRLREGRNVSRLLDPRVTAYIQRNGLYGTGAEPADEEDLANG